MQVKCKFSGVAFSIPSFPRLSITGEHPLMSVPSVTLLDHYDSWIAGDFTEVERKILFTALLVSTNQVQFYQPAAPSDMVVQLNMELLLRVASWTPSLVGRVSLPSFVINKETASLTNIRSWLDAMMDAKEQWSTKGTKDADREKLLEEEAKLLKKIRSDKQPENYAKYLAKWALETSGAVKEYSAENVDRWYKLFLLRDLEVYRANSYDLECLQDFMVTAFGENPTTYSHAVLTHISTLITKNRKGLTFALGLEEDEELDYVRLLQNPRETYRIHGVDVDTTGRSLSIAISATNDDGLHMPVSSTTDDDTDNLHTLTDAVEPVERDFPGNKIGYLKAKGKWIGYQFKLKAAREQMAKDAAILRQIERDEALDIVHDDEAGLGD